MTDLSSLSRDDAQRQIAQGQMVIDQIQEKMKKLVDEFAMGEISREQFQKIYERYQSQLVLAAQMMMDADTLVSATAAPDMTYAIRRGLTAKAKALTVYYYATGLLLETIGDFDISFAQISPVLHDLRQQAQKHLAQLGAAPKARAEKREDQWLLFVPGRYTAIVMLLTHEPAARQIGIIENMHKHFEAANETPLKSGEADSSTMVYPFQSVVRRSVAR